MDQLINVQSSLTGEARGSNLGSIGIRVFVLPAKKKKQADQAEALPISDLGSDEEFLADASATPLGSYLESSKGKRSCVFLVNGQRQDSQDNSFIVQELGFKYLRNRMMIMVDVDGLTPEAIGRLMQGSRQGFYRGDVWNVMIRRITATLKNDPDLLRIEEEAEEQISELEAGDEKVKQTLDQLIDSHHEHGWHVTTGAGAAGESSGDELGFKTVVKDGVVSLLPPEIGQPADYPVLNSQPASSNIRLRPNRERDIGIKSIPSNHWPAVAQFNVEGDPAVPELKITKEKFADHGELKLLFHEPKGFDANQYPVRAKLRVTANFNGIKTPRQLELKVFVKPDSPPPDPELFDDPTYIKVSMREPVKIRRGDVDTHVRIRWDGKDRLLTGRNPAWQLTARSLDDGRPQPSFNFSDPSLGRFSLLISPHPDWRVGDRLSFEIMATGPANRQMMARFAAEVVDPPQEPPDERQPKLVEGEFTVGTNRRPPYDLKYIGRDDYEDTPCWNDTSWTDQDSGCFKDPTERTPLTLIINKDMEALREYRRMLTKNYTEQEVERRVHRYTSHIAYHLYQMYLATDDKRQEQDLDRADTHRRDEIRRVAMTLIKLMEVAR